MSIYTDCTGLTILFSLASSADFYRPQGKVILSEACVSHFVHNWPHGYWFTAHPCYGTVNTHPSGMLYCYWLQQSCGQGYVFTRVCDSVNRGGVCLSACWDTTPCQGDPPAKEAPPLPRSPPPRKQTPAYGQWAAGTHPTGMHSCFDCNYIWGREKSFGFLLSTTNYAQLFSLCRSLFSRKAKETTDNAGWKLFGRVPPKNAPQKEPSKIQEEYQAKLKEDQLVASRAKKSDVEVLSTTALILENRPQ